MEPEDPWLARPGLRPIARAWAGDLALDDPRVSPLFGDLTRLPPVDVLVGTRDAAIVERIRAVLDGASGSDAPPAP